MDRGRAALKAGVPKRRVILALAAGAVKARRADRALKSLDQLAGDTHPDVTRARVAALRADGRFDEARRLVEEQLLQHPEDHEISAIFQAIKEPLDTAGCRGRFPLESLRRAEEMLSAGHPDRALRMLRRIRLEHDHDSALDEALVHAARAVDAEGEALRGVLRGLAIPELVEEEPRREHHLGPPGAEPRQARDP